MRKIVITRLSDIARTAACAASGVRHWVKSPNAAHMWTRRIMSLSMVSRPLLQRDSNLHAIVIHIAFRIARCG